MCPRCLNKKRTSGAGAGGKSPGKKNKKAKVGGDQGSSASSKKRKAPSGGGSTGRATKKAKKKTKAKPKRVWTDSQEALLTKAVQKLGAGKWKEMVATFDFEGKESKVLKDKWRTMAKRAASK